MRKNYIWLWIFSCIVLIDIHILPKMIVKGSNHDLFASLFELEMIWENELEVVEVLERVVRKWKGAPKEFKMYLKEHDYLELKNKSKAEYLGHPINAYHLIRHVALGWDGIHPNILMNKTYWTENLGSMIWNGILDDITQLSSRKNEILPDMDDVKGAARGIAKLWDRYRIDLKELLINGRIATTLKNGMNAKSEPSVIKLNVFDLDTMAKQALKYGLFEAGVVFAEISMNQTLNNKKRKNALEEKQLFGNPKLKYKFTKILLRHAKELNDDKLIKMGQYSNVHRTTKYPFDESKRKLMKLKVRNIPILDRKTLHLYKNAITDERGMSFEQYQIYNKANQEQGNVLCNGGQLKNKSERAHLRCRYSRLDSDWMHLGPMKIEMIWSDPQIVLIKELMYENECNVVTGNLAAKLKNWNSYNDPSKLQTGIKTWSDIRVMKNSEIKEEGHVILNKLNRRAQHITGFRANSSRYESEDILCGNYGVGGDYWAHMDRSKGGPSKDGPYRGPYGTGDRLATIVNILQAPKAGGATVFPFAGVSVFSEKGDGIYWHNLLKSGDPDWMSTHKACGVIIGGKTIGNKWIGYNNQWNENPCSLSRSSIFNHYN